MRRFLVGCFISALAMPAAFSQTLPLAAAPSKRVFAEPPGKIERNPGSEEDCDVAGDPHHAKLKLDQKLKAAATRSHEVSLYGGQRYRLIAMCDGNCSAMSLDVVEAATGKSLGKVDPRNSPEITFDLASAGVVRAMVKMDACSDAEGCKYGVGVYTLPPEYKPAKH